VRKSKGDDIMQFTDQDFNQTCLLKDGKPAMIIQINAQVQPFDVAAQVTGEPEARYITWGKFERINGVVTQVR